nr:uncharacterized protein LOC117601077 [Osmia lignaria]XP_034173257.1 uncharacterized protein LOC117601077 [Osmia lignaria]XP_034173258.1 uncharacterized protein LOC117601077 [Osmia lignaria]XP_034173259.1 uncharacterized protein LOC117601077 [Osmia lignaria]XP_034173260.1 uncharacterized protein LOC117601077 [Osmia lignaria]XP_034173261.1 uncharacterized protein LOC117601077 [Osmia lignaria]XP_034173262.1 uncharacterized protein LOC117601077 [Osmia lignaria]XP_034173263.1 uncharacterized p
MVLSVELLKRLNANEEPLPKRLKLAENVFHAVEVPIAYKEDLILQWLCKISNGDQKAWSLLRSCLKIKHLDIKINVKKLLVNTLIETLQKGIKDTYSDVFKCCELIIANDGVQQYFNSKPEELGLLIKCLLECIHTILECNFNTEKQSIEEISIKFVNKNDELSLTAYNTIITVIESMIQMYKTTSTIKDNLRTIFIRDVLYPVCDIIDHKRTDNTNRLGAVTYKCIQQLIFKKKHVQSKEFIEDKNIIQFENLLSILAKEAKTKDLQSNLVTFIFFFRAAINIFKTDNIILDLIFRELVKCAGIYEKEIFNSFLKNLNDVTFDFDNKIHNITLFDYCQNIIDNILSSKKMSRIDYDLLTQFCHFNPLLIEKNMQEILKKIFMGKSVPECTKLITSIMDVCIHLRQEEKIISTMLITLNNSLNNKNTEIDISFLNEFKEKFMKSVNNITSTQNINILRTLIYHLKTNCTEVLQSDDTCTGKNIVILQATVKLLTTFLDGTCVFEHTGTLAFYKKFVNDFNELRNILSLLIAQMLHLSYNEKITVTLLAAIFSWNEMQRALIYYMPKIVPQNLKFPISEDQWQQLIQRITNFGTDNSKNSMNKLILQQVRISQNSLSESSVMLNNLIGGLEYSWQYILKFDTQIIPFLNNEQISKIANLLLIQMTCNADNFSEWIEVLYKDSLQENRRLVLSLSNCVFIQIGQLVTGVTKSISEYFHTEFLLEAEMNENKKLNNILIHIKEELLKEKWIYADDTSLTKIKMHLEVLFHLPVMFLKSEIRIAMFMFIFALRMECNRNDEIISLCNTIFSDLLEKSDVNIFEYINPSLLLSQLPHNKITQRSIELFLRSCLSYAVLKKLVKSSMNSKKNILLLLKSMEHVKAKLNTDQKVIIKKAEKKISKTIMKTVSSKITEIDDLKILNLILKINLTNESVEEKLKILAQSILDDIFMNDNNNKIRNEMLQDGLQLATIILHNQKIFQITNETLRGIWFVSFNYPCVDVILPLLESSEAKEVHELFEHLHNQVIKALSNAQENDVENIYIIWNSILKINMSNNRSKLRLLAISKLIQTIQNIIIPRNLWPSLLKLIRNVLSTKHLYLPGYVIDMCIFVGLKALQETTISICSDTLELCNVLLKTRTSLITDRLPALLLLYRQILSIVVHKSKIIINKSEEYIFKCLALDIEKFINFLTKLRKELIHISPYLIADLLELFSEDSIASFVKISLQNCINHLISICDHHGIALLSRTLPISMQEMFKVQLNVYNQFYKFSGKI